MTLPISVVIPTFRRLATLPGVLEALARQTLSAERFEVVVVDDGSADGTAEFLSEFRPPYRFRALSQGNTGPAGAPTGQERTTAVYLPRNRIAPRFPARSSRRPA